MAYPQNPLDKFRQVSYHITAVVADSTATLDKLERKTLKMKGDFTASSYFERARGGDVISEIDVGSIDQSNVPEESRAAFEKYKAASGNKKIGATVLFNTRVDARYIVEAFSVKTMHGMNATMIFTSEATVTIREPTGFSLLNLLRECSYKYGTATPIAFHVTFTGHTPDGGVDTVNTGRLMTFFIGDVDAGFDSAGGTYTLKLLGLDDPVRGGSYGKIMKGLTLSPKDRTFKGYIKALEDVLNRESLSTRNGKVETLTTSQVVKTGSRSGTSTSTTNYDGRHKLVRYSFTLNDAAAEAIGNAEIESRQSENHIEQDIVPGEKTADINRKPAGGGKFSFVNATNVVDAVQELLNNCPKANQIFNQNSKKKDDDLVTFFKIIPDFKSTEIEETVHVTVAAYKVTKKELVTAYTRARIDADVAKTLIQSAAAVYDADEDLSDLGIIQYNYLFTGRNIDVMSCDIKLAPSVANIFILSDVSKDDVLKSKIISTETSHLGEGRSNMRPNMLPMRAYRSQMTPEGKAAQAVMKATLESIESAGLELTLTVRGNPTYLSLFPSTYSSVSPREYNSELNKDAGLSKQERVEKFNPSHFSPVYAKVNIFMPNPDEEAVAGGAPYMVPFFFRGLYAVCEVEHNFNDGDFHQILHLKAITAAPTSDTEPATGNSNSGAS